MSSVVTKLLVTRKTLIIAAAVASIRLVPRMRPVGAASVSPSSPCTCVITATPVSKPDMPRASLGKTSSDSATTINGSPCCVVIAVVQWVTTAGFATTCAIATAITTTLSAR